MDKLMRSDGHEATEGLNAEEMIAAADRLVGSGMSFAKCLEQVEWGVGDLDDYRRLIPEFEATALKDVNVLRQAQINLRSDKLQSWRKERNADRFGLHHMNAVRNDVPTDETEMQMLRKLEFVIQSRIQRVTVPENDLGRFFLFGIGPPLRKANDQKRKFEGEGLFYGGCDDGGTEWRSLHRVQLWPEGSQEKAEDLIPIQSLSLHRPTWATEADDDRLREMEDAKDSLQNEWSSYMLWRPESHARIALLSAIVLRRCAEDLTLVDDAHAALRREFNERLRAIRGSDKVQ